MSKILLVEDDNNLREIYEARLQAEGYQIVSAKDGEDALVVAKNEHPDLIISDVMMPKISGFEMLDILRNTEGLKDTKVIMLTALGQAEDQSRADKLGADRYLVKSQVTLEDIVKVSQQLLDGETADAATTPPAPSAPAPSAPSTDQADTTTAAVSTSTTPADDASQSKSEEEANVEKQIKDFIADQPASPPPKVEPEPEPADVTPEVTTPETAPSDTTDQLQDGGPAAAVTANENQADSADQPTTAPPVADAGQSHDDAVMSQAVDTLVASTASEPAAGPTPGPGAPTEAGPAAESAPTETEAEAAVDDSKPAVIAHKKVIKPLDDSAPKKSLDQLLAEEEAKEITSSPAATTITPTASPSNESQSNQPQSTAKPDDFDPNSIAL